jgi:hypothetical protein
MSKLRSVRTPPSHCLDCHELIDAASSLFSKKKKPRPGDFTVCIECGHIMAFAGDLTLRELTSAEMHDVAGNRKILLIQEARGEMRKVIAHTRDEHLAWCKQRALEYVEEGDLLSAVSSMLSDLNKHKDTKQPHAVVLMGMAAILSHDPNEVRRFIEGFN